ncbi:GTP cyclohydrolase I FolE [Paenibacillus barcinonensis]|uniref:GTP cyclohydrolase 1 n=1 Tax=Paenibacillus barcinonensis TaxID=198119 RepID=A0A2V4VQM3_PAEBA|nr:GTP cyclohydrolase I FolE [Paenibacillus barcinonensis]PYE48834.1 GTP cyclohydrolase I [Paenibacillus barcinonensis]QKS57740.1 GTP cyclohydrolase I FolE [Paenibacillus barcinonensis]
MKTVEQTTASNTALEQSIRTILQEIGENPNREGLLDTPARVARMYREVFSQVGVNPENALTTTFEESYEGSILVKDISYFTFCEHHLIPFYGTAHIAYIPNGKIVGLSKFARLVELTAARPQVQERMTTQIAEAIWNVLKPKGVIVSLEGTHLCMCARGVKKPGSATVTIVKKGVYAEQEELCQEFQRSLTR